MPAQSSKAKNKPSRHYIRNTRYTLVNMRISHDPDLRIQLQPRGQRGDLTVVSPDILDHPIYMMNKNVLFEELDQTAADQIISNQQINMQDFTHPALAVIRDQEGNPVTKRSTRPEPHNAPPPMYVDGNWINPGSTHAPIITQAHPGQQNPNQQPPAFAPAAVSPNTTGNVNSQSAQLAELGIKRKSIQPAQSAESSRIAGERSIAQNS